MLTIIIFIIIMIDKINKNCSIIIILLQITEQVHFFDTGIPMKFDDN